MNEYDGTNNGDASASGEAPSESWISSYVPPDMGADNVVNYYFPVQIVFSGDGLTPADHETIQANVFQDLYDAINRRLV